MKKMLIKLFEIFPLLEVIARKTYWSTNYFINKKKLQKKHNLSVKNNCSLHDFESFLKTQVVGKCNSIVIHSSYGEIKRNFNTDIKPSDLISTILNTLGSEITICFPTHPYYEDEIHDKSYMRDENLNYISTYNPKSTKAWTGVLPNEFLKLKNVKRSFHPINSMAAIGPRSDYYMEDNLTGDAPTACGINSSWKKLNDDSGFILGLGVDLVHSLTMIHVAEDTDHQKYKKDSWYRKRVFNLVKENEIIKIVVSERKPKWALYYAERRFKKDLINNNIIKTYKINDFIIEYIENSQKLIDFIKSKENRYPYLLSSRINRYLSR